MFTPIELDLERGWPGRIDGNRVVQLAAQTLQAFFTGGGGAREHAEYPLDAVKLRAPVLHPPSIRVFSGASFAFANPASLFGPDETIPYPEGSEELDYELGVAAIVGAEGAVGGFTVVNDWVAADLGPAKDRDFATSLGPVVVTPDELGGRFDVVVRVNGEERSRAGVSALPWEEMVATAARNTRLLAGDVLGSGALAEPGGIGLQPGDAVELEVEGIGVLRNTIGPRR